MDGKKLRLVRIFGFAIVIKGHHCKAEGGGDRMKVNGERKKENDKPMCTLSSCSTLR